MNIFDDVLRGKAKLQFADYVGEKGAAAEPGKVYLTIDLQALWIPYSRILFTKFYAASYGSLLLQYETKKREFQAFNPLGGFKELDEDHLNRIDQGPYRLLYYIPYRGNCLDIRILLMSIKASDLVAPYIKLLKSLSDTVAGSFMSSAVPVIDIIHQGISGLEHDSIQVGKVGSIDPVCPGYYAAVGTEAYELLQHDLAFDERLRALTLDGSPIEKYPYFVLKISTSSRRPSISDIPDLGDEYEAMKEHFGETPDNKKKNQKAFKDFAKAVRLSPDLLPQHAEKLIEMIREQYKPFLEEDTRVRAEESFGRVLVKESRASLVRPLQDFNPFE